MHKAIHRTTWHSWLSSANKDISNTYSVTPDKKRAPPVAAGGTHDNPRLGIILLENTPIQGTRRNHSEAPPVMTINEAAEYWNLHPNTIRRLITNGELQAVRLGARIIRIKSEDLVALFTPYQGGEFGKWSR